MFKRIMLAKKILTKIPKDLVLDNLNKEALKKYFHLEAEIVRSGLALEKYIFNSDKKLNKNEIKILMVGFLEKWKRYEDAILCIDILTKRGFNCRLLIVGRYEHNPGYFKYLEDLISSLGLQEKVVFKG
jgi:glycosyltransferase involved in cell wall biosynthesis